MCSPTSTSSSSTSSTAAEPAAAEPRAAAPVHKRLSQPSTSSADSSMATSPSTSSTELASYPLIPREQLLVQQQLGAGTYGSVFKGIWTRPDHHSPLAVALKKVFMLEKEVEILSQIRHRNIIQFYGVSQANPDYFIVTEYAENGSLYEHLHNKEEQISLGRTIKWAMQIARGVAYLHHEAPLTVIHRDLKSKNVVVGKKFQCKLCDFGTSKDLTHSWTAPSWGGTAAWMSPEIIAQREGITTATDVWSFAVVLWEMFSRQVPYKGLTEFKIYSIIAQHGVRLVIPDTCPEPLAKLLQSCWSLSPKERPDMRYVLAFLERMGQDKDLREECAQFLCQGKDEWRQLVQVQLQELDELKLDLHRQMEDLCRREQALRKRESSHRNFLHMVDILNVENVCEWNEDCVCEWVQNIAAAAVADFPEESVDKIISCVLQYNINGPRLLKITEKDLDCLDIGPVALRRYIILKVDELRELCNVQLCNVPGSPNSPANAAFCNNSNSNDSPSLIPSPIECPIVLHVGLYSRSVAGAYRFKVFLDSDWEMPEGKEPPGELQDSATVIKEVNISIGAADGTTLVGPVQCICPPFGYLEWAQLSKEEQAQKLPLTISMQITYTDQVIQPRNTRIQIKLDELASSGRTLCSKRIPLKLCPTPTDSSLSRISSQLLKSPPVGSGCFRSRRCSLGLGSQNSPAAAVDTDSGNGTQPCGLSGSTSNLLNRSPLWADLAASIRNSTFPAFRTISRSITAGGTGSTSRQLQQRSTSSEEDAIGSQKVDDADAELDPLQRARQRALAKVRRQKAERKKCRSESHPEKQQLQLPHSFTLDTPPSNQSSASSASNSDGTGTASPSARAAGTSSTIDDSTAGTAPTSADSGTASTSGVLGEEAPKMGKEQELFKEPRPRSARLVAAGHGDKKRPELSRLLVPAPENLMKMATERKREGGNKIEKPGRT